MEILGYGDRIPQGSFALHSAFPHALNFRGPNGVMASLVGRGAGNGPLNVVLNDLPRGARSLKAEKRRLYIDENRLEIDPVKYYDSAVPVLPLAPALFRKNLRSLKGFLGSAAPAKSMCFLFSFSARASFRTAFERAMLAGMKKGADLLEDGDHAGGARALRGLGFGLTPSGDDFLCGFLSGLSFMEANLPAKLPRIRDAVYNNAATGNFIAGSFLACAYHGRVGEKTGKLLTALAGPGGKKLLAAAGASLRTGHTSGADFCAGLIYGCEAGLRFA
ncbi:MAG: DUF2877 domain-containing protein [Elusimicrobiales bacterium]|jgi:hypothetical protein